MSQNVTDCHGETERLTATQLRAANYLVQNSTLTSVAAILDVSRRTVQRWQKLPEFVAVMEEMKEEIKQKFQSEIRHQRENLADRCLRAIWNELDAADGRGFKAAIYLIDKLGLNKILENSNINNSYAIESQTKKEAD